MKIPYDSNSPEQGETLDPQSNELFDDPVRLGALPEQEFYNYINEYIYKVTENQRDRNRLTHFLNKIDDLLEKNVNEYKELVSNTPEVLLTHKSQIDAYHSKFINILNALFKICKVNIVKFKSSEHLLKLIPVCLDYPIIRSSFHILFSKLNDEGVSKDDYSVLEPLLPRFSQNVNHIFQHYNLASFYSKSLLDIFQDDPRYGAYIAKNQLDEAESRKMIPEYTNELIFEVYKEKNLNTLTETNDDKENVISINIPNLKEKYPNESHISICKKIVEEYGLDLKEETPLWDTLATKIRACMNGASLKHRAHVVSAALDALKILICLRKFYNTDDTLKKYIQYLPPVFDFTTFVITSFELFNLKVVPDLHESIITCVSSILAMVDSDQDDFRDFSQQIMTQYPLFQKILKDCTTLQIEFQNDKPQMMTTPSLLPPETASNQNFFGCLLYMLHIGINHSFIDAESNLPSNQIYSITGIISSLMNVLKPPVNNRFLYNIESLNIALDTFWIILPNQNFISDLNIMDRLIERTLLDLQLLLQPDQQYYQFCDDEWKVIKKAEHFEVVQGLLKLLDSPFEHQVSSRVQMAPTMARKIGEGNLIEVFRKAIETDVINDSILMGIVLLVADIARELPNSVEGFIENGVIQAILTRLQRPFSKDFPHIHLIVYFVNMLGYNKKGFELEREAAILEKLFNLFVDSEQANNPAFIDLVSDIGKELAELVRSLEIYREPIADMMINNLERIGKKQADFVDLCVKKLKGEYKGIIRFGTDKSEKESGMEIEQDKKKEQEIVSTKPSDIQEEKEKTEEDGDKIMTKNELAIFEKDLKRISILIQTNSTIYTRLFVSEFKMREVMHKKNTFDYLLKMLSFPLISLLETTPISWIPSHLKHMANKSAGTDQDKQSKIYQALMGELDGIESLVGKMSEARDFSKVLNDDICYEARNNGLYSILNKYKEKSVDTLYLMGRLSYSEILIDFLKCHDPIRIPSDELYRLFDRLADLYVLIINQIKREDADFVQRNLETIKTSRETLSEETIKDMVEKCRTTIAESHSSNRFTYHLTLRKFFKKVLAADYEYESAEKYAKIILKILNQLVDDELKLGDEESTNMALSALSANNSILSYLHEFCYSTNYKRIRTHPEFFFTFYRGNGFHVLIEILNQLRVFTEVYQHHFQEDYSVSSQDKIKLSLIKEALSQNYQRLSMIMKIVFFMPIDPTLEARIDGLMQREVETKLEYFYGACKELINKFLNVFMGLGKTFEGFYLYHIKRKIAKQKEKRALNEKPEEKDKEKESKGMDTFYENMGSLLDASFECIKKIQDLSKEKNADEGHHYFGERNTGENHLTEAVIQALMDMGFPRERAEVAVRNAEYLSVESALSWLEASEELDRNRENQGQETQAIEEEPNQNAEENQPMEIEKENEGEEEGTKKKVVTKKKDSLDITPLRPLIKVPKEEFQKEVVNKSLQELSRHIIANIFFFEGYDSKVLDIIQFSLETQEGEAKKLMAQEIAVMIYKLLKHNVNNFTKGVKFLSKFKVSKSFEKSITFTKESLHRISTQKTSLLPKLRAINNVLPWFNHFLNYIPNIEKNLLKSDFVTELLRFFEQMLKEVDDAKESPDDQEVLYEIANTLTDKFFQTLFVVLKLKNSLEDSKRENKKENKGDTSKKESQSQTLHPGKETSQTVTEKETKDSKETKQSGKASTTKDLVKEGDKEKEKEGQGASQETAKKGIMELMIGILSQAEQFSLKHKRSMIFFQPSLCLYMKVLNLLLEQNQENVKVFIEKKGLQELIRYKLDSREPKGSEFIKEFGDICLSLISEPALDVVSLECEIKNFFFHLPNQKTSLRNFTEHFKERNTENPETFMALVKLLCSVEDKEKLKERSKTLESQPTMNEGEQTKDLQKESPVRQNEARAQGSRGKDRKKTGMSIEEQNKNRKQAMVISLKPEIEYSRLYSLSYLTQRGEEVKGYQPSYHLKKRKRSNKPEETKDDEMSNHILDFVPPSNSLHVIHTLVDNLVQQFNNEINEDADKTKAEKGEPQFYPIFSYSFILVSFQILLQKRPILSQPVLRQNVTKSVKNTLKNPAALKNLDMSKNISFLSYFLRVIVFSTMELFKGFLLSICTNTNLVVDKDRNGNAYPIPYYYEMKKKILSEIDQILQEGVANKPFYKTKEDTRLFCSISGLFFYLLPLKDFAKLVYDNMNQYNFLKIYAEALKQLRVGNYEHLEKLNVFVSDPYSVIVQYYHYFALNKDNQEIKSKPGDIWMPKKALSSNTYFSDEWKKLINPALKGDDYMRGRLITFPQDEDEDIDEDNMFELEEFITESENMGTDEEDDGIDQEDENNAGGIEGHDDEEGSEMQIEEGGIGDSQYSPEGDDEDDWTDIEEDDEEEDEDDIDDEMSEEDEGDEVSDDEEGDEDEDEDIYGENPDEIIIESVDDDDEDNLDEDDISEEYYDDSDEDDEHEHEEGGLRILENLIGRRPQVFSLDQQNSATNPPLASLINIPHANHPEIQRINGLMQATSIRFDNEGFSNIEDQPRFGSQLSNPLRLIRMQADEDTEEQLDYTNVQPRRQMPSEPATVFDRIHDTVAYLQSGQFFEDNQRRSEFHESFFEDMRRPNEAADGQVHERGLQAFRTLRDFFGRPGAAMNTLDNFLAIPLGRRNNRNRPINMTVGTLPFFSVGGGSGNIMRIEIGRPQQLPLLRDLPNNNNNNNGLEDFETQLLDELVPENNAGNQGEEPRQASTTQPNVQRSSTRDERNQEPSENPFEELNPEREGTQEGADRPRTGRGRRNREEDKQNTEIEEEEKKEDNKETKETPEKSKRETSSKKEVKKSASSFNFEAHGLESDFLEKNNIDPEFFNELDDELKLEIISEYTSKGTPSRPNPVTTAPAQTSRNDNNSIAKEFLNALNSTIANIGGGNQRRMIDLSNNNATGTNDNNPVSLNDVSNAVQNILRNTNTTSDTNATNPTNTQPTNQPASQNAPETQPNQTTPARNNTNNELMNTALDNAAFIASLTPDLREEVLLTADPTFLASLPPEMIREAEALQDRRSLEFNPFGFRSNIFANEEAPNPHELFIGSRGQNPAQPKKQKNFFREALAKDKALGSKLYTPDEKTIEAILKFMYMSDDSFDKFPFNLLKALMLHPQTEFKVLDCLFYLLKNPDLGDKLEEDNFPYKVIYEKNSIEKNYRMVYEKISLKILFLLENFTKNETLSYFIPTSGLTEESEETERNKRKEKRKSLHSLNNIRGVNREGNQPMLELIRLLSKPIISNSSTHMKILLNTLNNVTKHLKTSIKPKESEDNVMKTEEISESKEPKDKVTEIIASLPQSETELGKFKLDRELVARLCNCLSNQILEEDSLNKLSNIICTFCLDKHNFALFVQELKIFISKYSEDANKMLGDRMKVIRNLVAGIPSLEKVPQTPQTQTPDKKEEILKSLNIHSNKEKDEVMMNLLNRLDAETDYEIRLHKILRVIQELFEKSLIEFAKHQKKQNEETTEIAINKENEAIDSQQKEKVKDLFRYLFEDGQLQALWINITEFLSTLNEIFANNWAVLSPISHKLQPVLESFFIIYKILNDDEAYEIIKKGKVIKLQESKKPVNFGISKLASEGEASEHEKLLESSFQRIRQTKLDSNDMLYLMCEKNKNMLNMMVKQDPRLLTKTLSIVVKKMPKVLDFENKRTYFKSELRRLKKGHFHSLRLRVSRNNLFIESFNQIMQRKPHELRGKLNIEFYDEEGVDAGGVAREWFLSLSREILNPDYALFKPAAHGSAFQPSPQSYVNPDHLKFFTFVGRIIGKALHDGFMLDCYFTRSFYKHMLGQSLTYHDMEDIDPEYYRNLTWILENDVSVLDLNFSYEAEEFGVIVIRDLIPNGRNIPVTEENKRDYVQKICYARMANDIKEQIEAFLQGFHEVIPPHLIQIFDNKELELMISGLPDIDIQDLKENTEYHNYIKDSDIIRWFWEIMEGLDRTHKAAFLQFVTGTSKVPLGGFKELVGMGGAVQKFQIHKSFDVSKLPTSHTCFNQLDLPEYRTKEILKEKLMIAITEGKEGFGFV